MQRGRRLTLAAVALGIVLGYAAATDQIQRLFAAEQKAAPAKVGPDELDRTTLPIPEPKWEPNTEIDARKAKAPSRFQVKAPQGAPAVVIVLIDDMGYRRSGVSEQRRQRRYSLPGWALRRLEPIRPGRQGEVRAQLGRQGAVYTISSDKPLPSGKATIRYKFVYDGGKPGSGGKGTIFVNGAKVAEGRIEKTTPFIFSADETADVGRDDATPVTEDYKERDNKFIGKIHKVTIQQE
jgi:hypothetical protein